LEFAVPEGHTIHRVAADHNRHFAGQRLEARSPQGRFAAGARTLNGRVLKTVEAYGKHLLYRWEGKTLHIHLGLYGKFRLHKCPVPEPRGEVRLRVVGDARGFDLNGPTACELYSRQDETRLLERLGADPLRPDADCERLWERLSRSRSAIGTLLMNQSVIAGVGNVYRSEVLHLLHINPNRIASTLTRSEFDEMWKLIVELLKIGKRYNRIIIADPEDVGKPRSRMNRNERLLVYKQSACSTCSTPITSWTLAARKVFACPVCQPD
jgi:endonuclease-8